MAEFLNGHLFFTRRLQEYSGIKPIAVHLTYQFGDTADYVYGTLHLLVRAWGGYIEFTKGYKAVMAVFVLCKLEGVTVPLRMCLLLHHTF